MKIFLNILLVFMLSFWFLATSKAIDMAKFKSIISIMISNKKWDKTKLLELQDNITIWKANAVELTKDLPDTNQKKIDLLEIIDFFAEKVEIALNTETGTGVVTTLQPNATDNIIWDKSDYFKNVIQLWEYVYCIWKDDIVENWITVKKSELIKALKAKYSRDFIIDWKTACRMSYKYDNTVFIEKWWVEHWESAEKVNWIYKWYKLNALNSN